MSNTGNFHYCTQNFFILPILGKQAFLGLELGAIDYLRFIHQIPFKCNFYSLNSTTLHLSGSTLKYTVKVSVLGLW